MGIKSTFNIERQTAIAVIVAKINNCNNSQLADMLETFEESYFRNYIVYDSLPEGNDDYRTIRNFNIMKTSGFKEYRLQKDDKYYDKEIKALEIFNQDHYLEHASAIVFGVKEGTGFYPNEYLTEREEKIVLAMVQWMGTRVGEGFIRKLYEEL
jgi:hypothetical protein